MSWPKAERNRRIVQLRNQGSTYDDICKKLAIVAPDGSPQTSIAFAVYKKRGLWGSRCEWEEDENAIFD